MTLELFLSPSDAHRAVPAFHVARGVPGQRGDAVALLDAISEERVGKLARAPVEVGIGRADDRAFDRAADDFLMAVVLVGVGEHLVDRELPVLHQARHRARA